MEQKQNGSICCYEAAPATIPVPGHLPSTNPSHFCFPHPLYNGILDLVGVRSTHPIFQTFLLEHFGKTCQHAWKEICHKTVRHVRLFSWCTPALLPKRWQADLTLSLLLWPQKFVALSSSFYASPPDCPDRSSMLLCWKLCSFACKKIQKRCLFQKSCMKNSYPQTKPPVCGNPSRRDPTWPTW